MYTCVIYSNSSHGREYTVNTKSARKAAAELGRAEGGEMVIICRPKSRRVISAAAWTPENGGQYISVCYHSDTI